MPGNIDNTRPRRPPEDRKTSLLDNTPCDGCFTRPHCQRTGEQCKGFTAWSELRAFKEKDRGVNLAQPKISKQGGARVPRFRK